MSKLYIANAFSLQMLNKFVDPIGLQIYPLVNKSDLFISMTSLILCQGLEVKSVIGHEATALAVAHIFEGFDPEEMYCSKEEVQSWASFNRESISLNKGDAVLVFQYAKGRLDEGVILDSLKVEDFKIFLVDVE